jgi:hypothetical protein
MTRYFAHISASGPVRYGRFPFAIRVLEAPNKLMPIGMAFGVGRHDDGLALWKLTVHGAEAPGLWLIVDREFRAVPASSPGEAAMFRNHQADQPPAE